MLGLSQYLKPLCVWSYLTARQNFFPYIHTVVKLTITGASHTFQKALKENYEVLGQSSSRKHQRTFSIAKCL